MRQKTFYILGAVLLLAFAGYSFSAFQKSLTPYVSYQEAIASQRTVQVAGGLVKGSSDYDGENLHFTLVDPEDNDSSLRVRYTGVKPANFEDAISIVAIGRFDQAADSFTADKLLVKCPSKYQGLETKEYG